MRRSPLAALLAVALAAAPAHAEEIQKNDFTLDAFQGVILAGHRVTALGGAYAGFAEGTSGFVVNPASPALREPWSTSHVELDLSPGLSIPLSLWSNGDFDGSGGEDDDFSNFVHATLGAKLQVGPFGVGADLDVQSYTLFVGDQRNAVTVARMHALLAWAFDDGQLLVGAGARLAGLFFGAPGAVDLSMVGVGPELGLLWRPNWGPVRLGGAVRLPVRAGLVAANVDVGRDGVRRAGPLVLPEAVELPWELQLGFALRVGPRPLNPRWIPPSEHEKEVREAFYLARAERELARLAEAGAAPDERRDEAVGRARGATAGEDVGRGARIDLWLARAGAERRARDAAWPREGLLLLADLVVSGPVSRGVSAACFLAQGRPSPTEDQKAGLCAVGQSGGDVNVSPRLGLEAEPIPGWLQTRAGTYYEPARFQEVHPVGRQHFTFGLEVRTIETSLFGLFPRPQALSIQASLDIAPRYESLGVGLGVWH